MSIRFLFSITIVFFQKWPSFKNNRKKTVANRFYIHDRYSFSKSSKRVVVFKNGHFFWKRNNRFWKRLKSKQQKKQSFNDRFQKRLSTLSFIYIYLYKLAIADIFWGNSLFRYCSIWPTVPRVVNGMIPVLRLIMAPNLKNSRRSMAKNYYLKKCILFYLLEKALLFYLAC